MKAKLLAGIITGIITFPLIVASTPAAAAGCSLATLKDGYGYTVTGTIPGIGSIAAVGTLIFDGAGNVIGGDTVSASNGVVEPRRATGTYTVRQDCTSSFTVEFSAAVFAGTVSANAVIVNKGEEIQAIQTDPAGGVVLTFVAKKV